MGTATAGIALGGASIVGAHWNIALMAAIVSSSVAEVVAEIAWHRTHVRQSAS